MNYTEEIKDYLVCEIETIKKLDIAALDAALKLLLEARQNRKHIYVFGNGGSASTAEHFENDFNKGISEHIDQKFRFQCLNANTATLTAIANDMGYDQIFVCQLSDRLEAGDVVIAISGSGNSQNVIHAVEYAKRQDNKVIGLTGYQGGRLKELCDISLHVPVNSMQITEDIHMIFDHLMMSVLCRALCGIDHLQQESAGPQGMNL